MPNTVYLFWQCIYTGKFWSDFLVFIQSYFVSDFSFCFKDAFFGLFDYSKENTGKYYVINLCFLLAKFHIHKQKFTGSKPLLSLFKIYLDNVETIQNSANLKAMKTISVFILCVFLRCHFITLFFGIFFNFNFFVFVYNCNCTVVMFVLFN